VAGAIAGMVMLGSLFPLIAAAIRIDDGGPILFAHTRVGRNGRLFRMWKFRTMQVDAECNGGPLTIGADPRETRVGRFLRASKLDELPQLWNVLLGEMSLVGPRPESPQFVALYDSEQRCILDLVPGITDPAAIHYCELPTLLAGTTNPEEFYVKHVIPDKIRLQLGYATRATVFTDLCIVAKTFQCIARGLPTWHRRRSVGHSSRPLWSDGPVRAKPSSAGATASPEDRLHLREAGSAGGEGL
jgi:lipopolysaccharide/colanic/teichoic acid biosynthesis glycosyltransferase